MNALLENNGVLYFHQLYSYAHSCHKIFKEVSVEKFFESVSVDVNEDKKLTNRVRNLISILQREPPKLDTSIDKKIVLRFVGGMWDRYRETVKTISLGIQQFTQQRNGGGAAEQANPEVGKPQVEDFFKFITFILDLQAPNESIFDKDEERLWFERP